MIPLHYGELPDGRKTELYRLSTCELEASIITYGGRIVSLRTPDRHGRLGEVTLGYESLEGYLLDTSYLGALIGRYGHFGSYLLVNLRGGSRTLALDRDGFLQAALRGL